MYRKANDKPDVLAVKLSGLYKASHNKFWFDEIWLFVTHKIVFNLISRPIAWFDRYIIDGFMNMMSTVTNSVSRKIKVIQSGELQDYTWAFIAGTLAIIVLVVFI